MARDIAPCFGIALPIPTALDLLFRKTATSVRLLTQAIALFCGTTFGFNRFEMRGLFRLSSAAQFPDFNLLLPITPAKSPRSRSLLATLSVRDNPIYADRAE